MEINDKNEFLKSAEVAEIPRCARRVNRNDGITKFPREKSGGNPGIDAMFTFFCFFPN